MPSKGFEYPRRAGDRSDPAGGDATGGMAAAGDGLAGGWAMGAGWHALMAVGDG
jgi:hypothetical protein